MEIRKNIMSYAVYCLYGSTAKVHTSQKYFPCVHTPKEGVASLTAFLRSSDRNVRIHKSQTSIRTSTVFTFNLALLWKLCSILNILATCHSSWIWESIPAVDVFLLFCLCWRQSQEAGHAKFLRSLWRRTLWWTAHQSFGIGTQHRTCIHSELVVHLAVPWDSHGFSCQQTANTELSLARGMSNLTVCLHHSSDFGVIILLNIHFNVCTDNFASVCVFFKRQKKIFRDFLGAWIWLCNLCANESRVYCGAWGRGSWSLCKV